MKHRVIAVLFLIPFAGRAQGTSAPPPPTTVARGWEITGVPALNYDADEKFGYGAVVELYNYGNGGYRPYYATIQPTVFLTTGGRRDFTVFFDSPYVLRAHWRLTAFAGSEQQLASPYYGVGNQSAYDSTREREPNAYFYRFGRTRRQLRATVQHAVGGTPLRVLLGAGISHVAIDTTPFDKGTTLLARDAAGSTGELNGWSNHVRAGLVWDSRDREVGPHRGVWSELLIQRSDRALGSRVSFTRYTLAHRRYIPIGERLTFANRLVLQDVEGDPPFYELYELASSFKQDEALGGAKTIRGLPKNRYVGRGLFLWNSEFRWRAAQFQTRGKSSHLVLSAFYDFGRVWDKRVDLASIGKDLHLGYGGGVRFGYGENFVVAVDVGHSIESTSPVYIGLGYLF